MGDLEDAFADFLQEVEDLPVTGGDNGDDCPTRKKARQAAKWNSSKERAEALRKAAYQGNANLVEEALADLAAPDRLLLIDDSDVEDGYAALHLCVIRGHADVVRVLIQRRADVDLPSKRGDTALMWAAHAGRISICEDLLGCGADASAKNQNQTAASMARDSGHRRTAELLERHVAKVVERLRQRENQKASKDRAAEARRAANASMVAQAMREAKEKEQEDAYWASVRARRDKREAAGETWDRQAREEYVEDKKNQEAEEVEETASLMSLPSNLQAHYRLLEVPADAGEADVRKAYRRLALKWHPDKNLDAQDAAKQQFNKVATAYEAVCEYLANSIKRSLTVGSSGGVCVAPPSNY